MASSTHSVCRRLAFVWLGVVASAWPQDFDSKCVLFDCYRQGSLLFENWIELFFHHHFFVGALSAGHVGVSSLNSKRPGKQFELCKPSAWVPQSNALIYVRSAHHKVVKKQSPSGPLYHSIHYLSSKLDYTDVLQINASSTHQYLANNFLWFTDRLTGQPSWPQKRSMCAPSPLKSRQCRSLCGAHFEGEWPINFWY